MGQRITGLIRVTAISLLTCCSGCVFFEDLPPPDLTWSAMVPKDQTYGFNLAKASDEEATASRRARAYLAGYLPVSREEFIQRLELQHFSCWSTGSGTKCSYTRARPPEPCIGSVRVSVEVSFLNVTDRISTITEKDIDVVALVMPDQEHVDNRGCFPL
ncbi:MAG TPA: hypothetical protein VM639_03675 [Dongiaceae bacterium]|nr:hypothetical protein [Dongiaceae bacterium]